MTSRPIWMPLYVADYLQDTRHLTTLQHGAYLLLIFEYWAKGKLPSTDAERARVTGMNRRQWRSNRSALAAMFSPDWRHDRIESELQKANDFRLKRQVFGAKGGRSTREKRGARNLNVVPWNR